jgi:UDP-N-acetylmuramoylalanine--D-glutamate ligase
MSSTNIQKKIVVLGAGESGTGAAVLAKLKGFIVFVSDQSKIKDSYKELLNTHNITWEEGVHTEASILDATEVIKSPGIPDKAPIVKKIIAKEIPILSEIEFAGRYTQSKMVCITGSNGKTTTTMLTYHILKDAGLDVGLAGNVGHSLALQVAIDPHDYYVIELSSFQLDNMYKFKADIAILLNVTPDHLDRYNYEMQNYIDAKFRILQNQTEQDAFIYWNDDPIIKQELSKRMPAASCFPFSLHKDEGSKGYLESGELVLETPQGEFTVEQEFLALMGTHNMYNSLASGLSAKLLDIRNEQIRASLCDFLGVEHRLESVARVRGVDYINDSKATNVNSCWYALQSVKMDITLIIGGVDKGNDYTEIEGLVKDKVKCLIFLGVDNTKLHAFFDGKVSCIKDATSMVEAVDLAYQNTPKGQTVLLSPCCASFDLFTSYEDRGTQFKACVRNL